MEENGFEKYLEKNRGKFESGRPSTEVWQKLQTQLVQYHQTKARVVRMRRVMWGVAACILLCICIGLIIFKRSGAFVPVAKINKVVSKQILGVTKNIDTAPGKKAAGEIPKKSIGDEPGLTMGETRQSLFYYSRLIEIRQRQFRRLQAIDPDLYRESQRAINNLNSVYERLRVELSGSINQEKVLESMIENLQMQEQILNNQLQIIKELESKDNNHDKQVKGI